ncbi:MAG: TPM domain-containing protein [Chitinophagales bacterium]
MKFLLKNKILAVLVCICFQQINFAQVAEKYLPQKPSPQRLVNDFADVLNDEQETVLENKLVAFDDSTSTQIAIVTVEDTKGFEISDYAFSLGDNWGIGRKDQDNGVLLLVAVNDRNIFIATGKGVEEFIPDARANRLIDEVIVPHFKNGNYFEGLDAGTDKLMLYTQGQFDAASDKPEGFSLGGLLLLIIIIIIVLYILGKINRNGGVTYSRRGPTYWGGGFGGFGGGKGFGGGGFGGFGGGGFGGGGAGGRW